MLRCGDPPEAEGLCPGYRGGCERWNEEAAVAGLMAADYKPLVLPASLC